jgi:hypothetical protein
VVSFEHLATLFLGGDVEQYILGAYGPFALSTLAVLLLLAVARFFHVRQIFLRV